MTSQGEMQGMEEVREAPLFNALGDVVAGIPVAALTQQGTQVQAVVWRGRVFLPSDPADVEGPMWLAAAALVRDTPFACPDCGAERADYEGEPGMFLALCPACESSADPVPAGLAPVAPGQVMVPREFLSRARWLLRAVTGHALDGFTSDDRPVKSHDTRGPGGMCAACLVLAEMDEHLYQRQGEEGDGDGESDAGQVGTQPVGAGGGGVEGDVSGVPPQRREGEGG
jgi:hypothetical protein